MDIPPQDLVAPSVRRAGPTCRARSLALVALGLLPFLILGLPLVFNAAVPALVGQDSEGDAPSDATATLAAGLASTRAIFDGKPAEHVAEVKAVATAAAQAALESGLVESAAVAAGRAAGAPVEAVSYTHIRAHET